MLSKIYYAQNYAGITGLGLQVFLTTLHGEKLTTLAGSYIIF